MRAVCAAAQLLDVRCLQVSFRSRVENLHVHDVR